MMHDYNSMVNFKTIDFQIRVEYIFGCVNKYTKKGALNSKVPDIDNILGSVNDAMEKSKLILNDKLITSISVEKILAVDNNFVIISIYKL